MSHTILYDLYVVVFCFSFLLEEIVKVRYVLSTAVCYDKKTKQQLCKEINSVIDRFDIGDKDITYVSDAGPNIVAALKALGVLYHLCEGMLMLSLPTNSSAPPLFSSLRAFLSYPFAELKWLRKVKHCHKYCTWNIFLYGIHWNT